ncbi:MAG TPA: c-type cytochrome [Terracidiphilus sp.]|nr:c-type cytochrome [Terracidiphilus sp.]
MKLSRIAVLSAVAGFGFLVVQFIETPTLAARQQASPAGNPPAPADAGKASYANHCAICHGDQREGILPGFPPLVGIGHQMSDEQIISLIRSGKGRMPGFPDMQSGEMTALVQYLATAAPPAEGGEEAASAGGASGQAQAGRALFHQNCAFCHGRDAMGGETGPDLTQSELVKSDKTGEKIAEVIRDGRPAKKMPAFKFSPQEVASIEAFIHARIAFAELHPGGRRGVAVADLQTGNAQAGKQYFDGAGGCVKCHSATGDLAGIANRLQGLQLERRMLYPEGAQSSVTVTLPSGKQISGKLAYLDEFTVALRDSGGTYHSWSISRVHYKVDAPVEAHAELFPKYSDDDIHNLMAYLQTLR